MSNRKNPELQDDVYIANVNAKIDRLSLQSAKDSLDHYLFETAERSIIYFSRELRMAFCESEKLLMLPPAHAPIIRARSAAFYIEHALKTRDRVRKLYLPGI